MGHIAATPFGVSSPFAQPLQQTAWGISPYSTQAAGVVQSLQAIAQQLQQLQQLNYVQQQQLHQLQQFLQIIPQQILQQLSPQPSPLGFPVLAPFIAGQPGQVM